MISQVETVLDKAGRDVIEEAGMHTRRARVLMDTTCIRTVATFWIWRVSLPLSLFLLRKKL